MKQHVKVVGYLYIGLGLLHLLVAAVALFAIVLGGLISGDPEAIFITSIAGPAIALFVTALALPGIIGGFGLLKGKQWARLLLLVLAIFNLVDFPLGTLLGVYSLYVLLHGDTTELFSGETKYAAAA